jgi:hypothetical protein
VTILLWALQCPLIVYTDLNGSFCKKHDETFFPSIQTSRNVFGERVMHRTNRYLNNRLEQDQRGIKQRYRSMCGFKTFNTATHFCRVFDEIRSFLRPQAHCNQCLTPQQRRATHRAQFTHLMGIIAAAQHGPTCSSTSFDLSDARVDRTRN